MHVVTVWDTNEDGLYHNVLCADNNELVHVLLDIQPRYKVVNIQVLENIIDIKDVVVQNDKLEHGGQ